MRYTNASTSTPRSETNARRLALGKNGEFNFKKGQQNMAEPRKYKSSKRGDGRTQKRIGVAIDSELEDWLNTKPNKNRYINELIRQDMTRHKVIITTAGKPEMKIIEP